MMKIIADAQSKLYELTYVLPADLTKSELEAAEEVVNKLIAKYKGEVKETQDWGKKDLAYKIKFQGKQRSQGVYTHLQVAFLPQKVQAFEKEFLLLDEVMRHLLVVAEDHPQETQESQKKEKKATE